ncbi:MAG: LamG-like jellyroll fold domain-containing protein [Verrucomicrobiota bacterium]
MKTHTRTAPAVELLRLPALKTLARTLTAALLLAATMPLSSPAQTLPVTSGLQLWLKADAGVTTNGSGLVTTWADQSGLHNDAIQANSAVAPSVALNSQNGKPTLRFPGDVTRYLDVADSASISGLADDVTILAVVSYDDLTGGYRCCVTKTLGNGPAPFDWWNIASASGGAANFWLGAAPDGNTYHDSVGTNPPRLGALNVMTFSWGSGTANQYLNDRSNGTSAYTTTTADGGTPLRIGSRDDLATQLKGNVAEILIYQPALSDGDRASVINYLHTKWNLNFIVPPSISIQTPTNGLNAAENATVSVSVEASDSNTNGVLTSVTLLNNGASVASWTQPPYDVDLFLLNPGKAVLTAVAADNFGASATSAPVSLTVTGAAPVSQPITNGLRVWLRADTGVMTNASGLVTNWVDQSGNGNDAAQANTNSAPVWTANVINGEPALEFGSSALSANQFLEVSDAGTAFTTNSFTILVEAQFADFATYRSLVCKTGAGIAAPFDWWFAPSTGIANGYVGDGATYTAVASTMPATAGQFDTFGLGFNGTNLSHYLGLVSDGTGAITTTAASVGNPMRIGQRDDAVTQMAGAIAEILVYNHSLAANDQSNAVIYLSGKYGVAQAIVSNPPVTLSITSPADGATFPMSSAVPAAINASISVGSIVNVLLLANGFQVVSLTNSPYQVPIDLLTPGSVSLTAVVVDNLGLRSTSPPVVLTVTGSAATAPPTNDLRLWLSADAGVQANSDHTVASWTDRSGNGNVAIPLATSPTLVQNAINGKPALHFNAGDYLDVATAPSIQIVGDISCYAVVLFEDFAYYRGLCSKTKGNLPASFDYYVLVNTGVPQFFRGNGTAYGAVAADQAVPAGAYMVLGYEMAGQTATHFVNGASAGSGQITAALGDAGTDLKIGTRDDLVTQMKGDIAELLVFGHALSLTEHGQLLSYLGGKYNQRLASVAYLPPTVTILSPTNGATEAVSTPFNLEVSVTDTNNPITQVTFLANGNVVGSATAPPYTLPLEVLSPGTVTLQAQAVDIWGAAGTSAPVVLTVTGQGPATPPASGLVLWLRADKGVTTNSDGTVAEWADQSGLGNNAFQTNSAAAPMLVINAATSRPALEFNGTSSQYLDVASAPSVVIQGDISSFCAFNVADVATAHTLWGKTTNDFAFPWDYGTVVGGNLFIGRGNNNGVAPVYSSGAVEPGSPAVAGFTVAGSLASLYIDGEPAGSGVFGYGALDVGTPLRIGSLDDLTNQFAGTISEVLIYNRALSGNDLVQVNTYLAGRSSIAVVEPAPPSSQGPSLTITRLSADSVQISWPTAATGFVLQSETSLASGAWTPVATNPPNNQFILGTTNVTRFFRLQSQ